MTNKIRVRAVKVHFIGSTTEDHAPFTERVGAEETRSAINQLNK